MIEGILTGKPWLVGALFLALLWTNAFLGRYIMGLLQTEGARRHLQYEGLLQADPLATPDRRVRVRFVARLLFLSGFVFVLMTWLGYRYGTGGVLFFRASDVNLFIWGCMLLPFAGILSVQLRNLHIIRRMVQGEEVAGQIRYSQRLSSEARAMELLTLSLVLAVALLVVPSAFLGGAVFMCATVGLVVWRKSVRTGRSTGQASTPIPPPPDRPEEAQP